MILLGFSVELKSKDKVPDGLFLIRQALGWFCAIRRAKTNINGCQNRNKRAFAKCWEHLLVVGVLGVRWSFVRCALSGVVGHSCIVRREVLLLLVRMSCMYFGWMDRPPCYRMMIRR